MLAISGLQPKVEHTGKTYAPSFTDLENEQSVVLSRSHLFALVCPDWAAPSLVLDANQGHVAYANLGCIRLLERRVPAALIEGRLSFSCADVNRRFYRVLHQTAQSNCDVAVVVGRCETSLSWFSVTIRNALGLCDDIIERSHDPRYFIIEFALNRQSSEPTALAALGQACSLSPAELEVVRLLVCGWPLFEIAKVRGVTLATMRQRMKVVLAKTNCHRQTELVYLVMSLCPASYARKAS